MNVSKHGLSKSLRQVDILVLSFGAMIGWSWVVLISQLMQRAGSVGAIVATLIAGGVIIVIGMIYAELTAAMPEVGGEHAYSLRAMGKTASFYCTWSIVFAYISVVAFEAVALPSVITNIFPRLGNGELWRVNGASVYLNQALIGALVSILITWINIRGVRITAIIQRPYQAPGGKLLGWFGLMASLMMMCLYLPGMPAALVWPQEWLMVICWFAAGSLVYFYPNRVAT